MKPENLKLTFEFATERPFVADFSAFAISSELRSALCTAFAQCGGGYSRASIAHFWTGARRFANFLETNTSAAVWTAFPGDILALYRNFIASQPLRAITKNNDLNQVIRLLKWIRRNRPSLVYRDLDLAVRRFTLETVALPRTYLSESEIKRILRICEEEMDSHWDDFLTGQRLLSGLTKDHEEEEVAKVLQAMLAMGNGVFPLRTEIRAFKSLLSNLNRRVDRCGGFERLKKYCFLTTETFIPFYLSLVAQTAGNPDAILQLRRDAVVDHEIFGDSKFIVWEKLRGAREQRREYDVRKKNAPPNIIARILKMTERLVPYAEAMHRNRLFLHQSYRVPAPPCRQTVHTKLDEFIEKHDLPNFDPGDLRRTSAELHEKVGGIYEAKILLNHKDSSTTEMYLNAERKRFEHDRLINKFQGELARRILNEGAQNNSGVVTENAHRLAATATTFGFDCADPFSGIAPGSVKGEVCEKFYLCAGCRGAIVVLDDPRIAAKLIQARAHLQKWAQIAHTRGWGERFDVLYAPTLEIAEGLIQEFESEVFSKGASIVVDLPPLPDLE